VSEFPYGNFPTISSEFWGSPVGIATAGPLKGKKYCPGYTGDTFSKLAWNTVLIGGILPTPGLAEVDCKKSRDLDKKKSKGSDGARITISGYEPAIIAITITIWTPDQLDELIGLWDQIQPKPGKAKKDASGKFIYPSFDVRHPTFSIHGVKSIQIKDGVGLDKGDIKNSRKFVINAIEYTPAPVLKKNATATTVQALTTVFDPIGGAAQAATATLFPKPGDAKANKGPK